MKQIKVSEELPNRRAFQMETLPVKEGDETEFYGCIWVEGIGNVDFYPCMPWYVFLSGGNTARLISCSVGDRKDYVLILPTPPIVKEGREVLHSLDGRRLAAPPQQGVYLRNGKKVAK